MHAGTSFPKTAQMLKTAGMKYRNSAFHRMFRAVTGSKPFRILSWTGETIGFIVLVLGFLMIVSRESAKNEDDLRELENYLKKIEAIYLTPVNPMMEAMDDNGNLTAPFVQFKGNHWPVIFKRRGVQVAKVAVCRSHFHIWVPGRKRAFTFSGEGIIPPGFNPVQVYAGMDGIYIEGSLNGGRGVIKFDFSQDSVEYAGLCRTP